ncbi:MAG TPA: CHASE3 domain-containing protein [Terriglobia bacterium]|nr:CHASE3 domain-containing protein [Terriglobia bacterium]
MKWTIGSKIGSSFALALAVLIVVGAVSYDSTAKLIESADWVSHTQRVLSGLDDLISTLENAETGQRGYVITGEERYLQPYQGTREAVEQRLKDLRKLTSDNPIQQQRLDAVEPLVATKFAELQEVIDLRKNKGFGPAAQEVLTDKGKNEMDEIRKLVGDMGDEENNLLAERSTEERDLARRTEQAIVFGTLFAVLLLILVGVFLTRNIASPLGEISGAAQRIASGDLVVAVPSDSRRDEVGVLARTFTLMTQSLGEMARAAEQIAEGDLTVELKPKSEKDILGKAFATMRDKLRRVTGEIQESVNILSSSAQQIVATTTQVASGAAETATAVAETTTTLEEVKQTAQLSTQKAKYVSDSAQKAAQVSQSGKKSAEESIEGMKRIRQQMESIAESIVRLSEQSQAIGEIMITVNDLAEQSNLLAVNASIEAAKAGEQGKGFAVVAQEVRSLAEQSKQATAQVRTILNDIQKATGAAVMATEQGSKAVEAGVKQSGQAGESVQKLAESIAEAAQAATQIAASSQQQMVGMDQVAQAMESIKTASTQNVASTRQTETAARNMQELGRKLKELVALYKV